MGGVKSVFRNTSADTTTLKRKVAIIGGGPGGMGVARALQSHGFAIDVFEPQPGYGGVWNYTGKGPMYRDLDTNIVVKLMEYKDVHFKGSQGYRDRADVYEYVVDYCTKIDVNAHFNTEIAKVSKVQGKWKLIDTNETQYEADFLVVATGHYNAPFTPDIEGLQNWKKINPGSVLHSRHFDNPEPFAGRKVLVVGNAASGLDVAIQVLSVTAPVTVCRRHEAPSDELFDGENLRLKPEMSRVDGETRTIYFTDDTSEQFDVIMFCTGYLYEFPFLDDFSQHQEHPILHPKRQRLCNLYRRTFYLADPTLAVVGMEKQIVPMPVAEQQGAAIARVFAGQLELPSVEEMLRLEKEAVAERGDGQSYHLLGYPKDAEWMADLYDWVQSAQPHEGFYAEKWDEEKLELRKNSGRNKLGEFRDKIDQSNRKRKGKG